jgi:hypothetical protein
MTRKNKYPQQCCNCGILVAAGDGVCYYNRPDDGGDRHLPAGWLVSHKTEEDCARAKAKDAECKTTKNATGQAAFAAWLSTAPESEVLSTLPTGKFPDGTYDRYRAAHPLEGFPGCYVMRGPGVQVTPTYYREKPDGAYAVLGECPEEAKAGRTVKQLGY